MRIIRYIILIAIAALTTTSMSAQSKKKNATKEKAAKEKVKEVKQNLLYENMLESTQRVVFIDSVVTDLDHVLDFIHLPKECGKLGRDNRGISFTNEFGNKQFFSATTSDSVSHIYSSDKLGSEWSNGVILEGINTEQSAAYPFMMADGVTLYFAQKGNNSIGGYDIFRTRYDASDGHFLNPENIGLPFNSEANDYLYVEDELDSIGWFVTDRRQPEGKVCVYTFIPNRRRTNYNLDEIEEAIIRNYADLTSIKATWPSEKYRNDAIKRLQQMKKRALATKDVSHDDYEFVINDQTSYTTANDFRSDEARQLFSHYMELKERAQADTEQLEALRDNYANADDSERTQLSPIILDAEQTLEKLLTQIKTLKKEIRKIENNSIN